METKELFEALRERAEKVSGRIPADLAAVVRVELTGPDPAQWLATAAEGRVSLVEDRPEAEADLTVTLSAETALGLHRKTLSPVTAFLTGKVKVKGDTQKIALLKGLLGKKGS